MKNPLTRSKPDSNSPTMLASELAAARVAYIATRSDVYERAVERVRALDEVIDEAEQERQEVLNVMAQAEPVIPAPPPFAGSIEDGTH